MKPYKAMCLLLLVSTMGCGPQEPGSGGRQSVVAPQPAEHTQPAEPTTQPSGDADAGRSESRILAKAFGGLLAECVVQIRKDTGQFPPGAKQRDFPVQVLEKLLQHHRQVLLTTPRQEADFAADDFDDEANRAAIAVRAGQAKEFHLHLPMLSRAILSLNRAGKLEGAQLELARRILDAQFNAALASLPGLNRE